MKNPFSKNEESDVDPLITVILAQMERLGPSHEDYPAMMAYLERLYKVKANQRPDRVDRNTLAIVAGNLLGIVVVVAYERVHVMTSKGLTLLTRTN